jgi:hypothetical protein
VNATPHCRVSFDPKRQKWGYATNYPGAPIHNQAWVWDTSADAMRAADPHDERIWQESAEGFVSDGYRPGTVAQRMNDWTPARRRKH